MSDPTTGRGAFVTRRVAFALILGLAVLVPSQAPAAQYTAARKLGRGFAGMTCGVMELPGNIVKTSRERGPGWGFTLGFVEGLGMIVVRELVGVYEFVTAPIEVPAGYAPIIHPEFPWGYFDQASAPHRRP